MRTHNIDAQGKTDEDEIVEIKKIVSDTGRVELSDLADPFLLWQKKQARKIALEAKNKKKNK